MTTTWFKLSVLLGLSLILGLGCSELPPASSAASPTATVSPATSPAEEKPAAAKQEVPIKIATWEETKALIAREKGKVVVLDFWSTYCPPCLQELPNLVKIHEKFGKDVTCMSLNCNYAGTGSPEDDKEAVVKVLADRKAFFLNIISSDADEELYKKVGIASIPVIQIYDRQGTLVKQFDNEKGEYGADGFTYEKHVIPFVEKLMSETSK